MTLRTTVRPLGFGLSAILCVSTAPADDAAAPRRARPPASTRTRTSTASVPSGTDGRALPSPRWRPTPTPLGRAERPGAALVDAHGRGEEYWRREAERVRDKVRAMETQADKLRLRIAERAEEAGRQSHPAAAAARGSGLCRRP